MRLKLNTILLASSMMLAAPAWAAMSADEINGADPLKSQETAAMVRLQTLLDRAGASVGPIDGKMGDATSGAITAYETMQGMEADGELDEKTWSALSKDSGATAQEYEITQEDVSFELTPETPDTFKEMAEMEKLGYHRYSEALAEKFHMTEELLMSLNPDADFSKAGTKILVTKPGEGISATVARIVIDKGSRRLKGYDGDKLVFSAPAAIGSDETPSPSGTMKVTAIAPDPNYTFSPKNIQGAETKEEVIIPPGPNGPVGSMWIDLEKPTYGIHGTPDPVGIFSAQSNGCVRLTNWDANSLAQAVKPGSTTVEFTQ